MIVLMPAAFKSLICLEKMVLPLMSRSPIGVSAKPSIVLLPPFKIIAVLI